MFKFIVEPKIPRPLFQIEERRTIFGADEMKFFFS